MTWMWHNCAGEERAVFSFSSLLSCRFKIKFCSVQHLLDIHRQIFMRMEKQTKNMKHESCRKKKLVKKKHTIHTSKSRQRAFERQLFWHWLVPHSCQSRRVVFIFMLQQKTGKRGERRLKRPWPEPYAVAVTFIASHIISKLSKKHFSLDTWTNWAGFHLLLCLTTLVGSVQSGFHSPLCPSQWIMLL